MRILVIDDSEDARDLLAAALASGGHLDITFAVSGEEGLQVAAEANPTFDIVFLDILMVGIDGVETCARLRTDPRYADLPIIMVTSNNDMDSLQHAFIAGATDYITKPFNRIELLARLRGAVRLKGELDRRKSREAELVAAYNEARANAGDLVDRATGLLSRQAVEALLREANDQRDAADFSVLVAQIDAYDRFRQAHGSAAAEQMFRDVAAAARRLQAPLGALLAAYDDGVLMILAPAAEPALLARLAAELVAAVRALAIPHRDSGSGPFVTLSVGASSASGEGGRHPLSLAIEAAELAAEQGGARIHHAPTRTTGRTNAS
ncbi:response regulator [Phenylobacterium sp. LjRoot225]|uniref:response regulator n=1 Tax=Phenylobacterium sp. LjRoot225 TaxID=3342285 RepID=UPI003ECF5B16